MRFLNKNIAVVTLVLVTLLFFSGFMIIRLEIKAASLQSRLDEHHNQLKKNSDELDNLGSFMRRVGDNVIFVDKSMLQIGTRKSRLSFSGDKYSLNIAGSSILEMNPESAELSVGDYLLQMDKSLKSFGLFVSPTFGISLSPDNKSLLLENSNSLIDLKNNKIKIEAKGDITIGPSKDKKFGYSKSEDKIYLKYGEARMYLGELQSDGKSLGNGIHLIGKTGGPFIVVGDNQISLEVPSKEGKYSLWIDPTKKLVGIKQGKSSVVIQENKINMEAEGDINITSKNGKVNINGKR